MEEVIAAVCLMVCGVIFFVASVGHAVAASAAYLLVSRATASADMGVPLRVQSSGASGRALRSAIHSAAAGESCRDGLLA